MIEAVGRAETWNWSVEMLRRGGVVNFFGGPPSGTRVELDTNLLHYSEITCKASFHHTPRAFQEALEIIESRWRHRAGFCAGRRTARKLVKSSVPAHGGQWSPEDCHHSMTVQEAEQHTRKLATTHYENFHVVSFLLPKHLHQDFYNVYAYCRSADDLADEIPDTAESLSQLNLWRGRTGPHVCGRSRSPGLRRPHGYCCEVRDSEAAFRGSDPRIHSGPEREPLSDVGPDLLDYCVYYREPRPGRLVLYLCGYSDPERQRLSDATCTALQLANFWQDITIDQQKDRVYLPLDLLAKHNYTVEELFACTFGDRFRAIMREAVGNARDLFLAGLPFARMVNRRLAVDLELFSRGGLWILDEIERRDYDVLSRRPKISKAERVSLLIGTLARLAFQRAA